jgi:hypothetical protein
MASENIRFYILPGFDTLSVTYKDKFHEWEKIGIQRSGLSRTDLAEILYKTLAVRKETILPHIHPSPKSSEVKTSDVVSSDTSMSFLDIPSYSETVIYSMDGNNAINSFFILRLEMTRALYVRFFCSPYYSKPSIQKVIEYARIMGATSIRVESPIGAMDVYEALGFVPDLNHYSDIQLTILRKNKKVAMIRTIG